MTISLIGSWIGSSTTNNATLTVSVTGSAPAGSKLVLAINKSAANGVNNGVASISDTRGNTYVKRAHAARAATHDLSIYECTGSLQNGDVVTITFNEVNTRKAAILSAWSGVGAVNADSGNNAFGSGTNSVGANGSSTTETVTATGGGAGLVIAAFTRAGTETLTPNSPLVLTSVDTVITATGSSDRGLTLAYYIASSMGNQTSVGTLSASQGWAASSIVLAPESGPIVQSYDKGGAGGLVASCTVNKPAGTVSGDLLLGLVNTSSASATLTATGFTTQQIASTGMWWVWKIAGGSEGASYTFTRGTSPSAPIYAVLMRVTGHNPSTPIDVTSGAWGTSGTTGAPIDAPGVTATSGGLLLSVATRANDVAPTVTVPSGMTPAISDTAHANCAIYSATLPVSSGATGNKTWGFSGTGSNVGYAVGNVVINAPATIPHGSASGSYEYSGSAVGTREQYGDASGTYIYSGTATGHSVHEGIASGSVTWAGSAIGSKDPRGNASGGYSWSGSGDGHRNPRATSSGSYSYSGTSSGHTTRSGDAAGSYTFAGSAIGHRVQSGDASESYSWSGSASGHETPRGSASGSYQWTGIAVANDLPHGQALGSTTWSGTATGHVDRSGDVTGSISWTGSASGSKEVFGSATGSMIWTASASGHRQQKGSVTGSVAYSGSASGTREPRASVTGSQSWSGSVSGTKHPIGATLGQMVWAGLAQGNNNTELPTPPERIIKTPVDNRVLSVSVENRSVKTPVESRTF